MNTEGMAVELAIRQGARSDDAAAAAMAGVDVARLENIGHLYRATGLPTEQADAQAFLFYCLTFGQSLLFLERGPRKRSADRKVGRKNCLTINPERGRTL